MSDTQEMEIPAGWMRWIPWIFAGIVILLYLPHLLWNDLPLRDVADRYAPMAEAFARGDYLYAFHPRVQFLHPFTAGGFVRLTGMSGFMGAKCSSLFYYALCAFPLFHLLKRVFSIRAVIGGMSLYLFASRLMVLVYPGLRESLKCLVLLLLALAAVTVMQERTSLKGYLLAGIAAGSGVMARSDLILFAGAVLLYLCVLDWTANSRPWRTLVSMGTAFVFALPEICINYYVSGYASANIRFGRWHEAFFGSRPDLLTVFLLEFLPLTLLFFLAGRVLTFLVRKGWGGRALFLMLILAMAPLAVRFRCGGFTCSGKMAVRFIQSLLLGTFPAAAIAALISILYRAFRKIWRPEETFLLLFYFAHGFLIIYQILLSDGYLYVSARYLLPVSMVLFGWSASAIILAWSFFRRVLPRPAALLIGWILFLAGCIGFYGDGSAALIKSYTKRSRTEYRRSVRKLAEFISSDYRRERYYRPVRSDRDYQSCCRPTVLFTPQPLDVYSVSAYIAGGSSVSSQRNADYVVTSGGKIPPGFEKTECSIPVKGGYASVWRRKQKP